MKLFWGDGPLKSSLGNCGDVNVPTPWPQDSELRMLAFQLFGFDAMSSNHSFAVSMASRRFVRSLLGRTDAHISSHPYTLGFPVVISSTNVAALTPSFGS